MSNYTEFEWKSEENQSHKYILPVVKNILSGVSHDSLILDAGCGSGGLIKQIHGLKYSHIYGVDASRSGIELAKTINNEIKNQIEVHDIYNKNLPTQFPQKNYDLIVSLEVIEHLYSPKKYLENINLWLKKGGLLVLSTPYHGYWKNLAIAILNKFDSHTNPLFEGGHIKFFSFKTLNKIIEENGFKLIRSYGVGRVNYLWKSMIIKAEKL